MPVHRSQRYRPGHLGSVEPGRIVSQRDYKSLRDAQEAASRADPRTIMRYDRARVSLDQHANYILAAYIATTTR